MPTPEICKSYNLGPDEYDDCINYRGHYSTPAYENGGQIRIGDTVRDINST